MQQQAPGERAAAAAARGAAEARGEREGERAAADFVPAEKVEHVSGDDGAADIFRAALDVGDPPTPLEAQGHETVAQSKRRTHGALGKTDAQLLAEEHSSPPPSPTRAGRVELPVHAGGAQ